MYRTHSPGGVAGAPTREKIQEMIEWVLLKVSTYMRIYLWLKTRNEELTVQKECLGQGYVELEKGASRESSSVVVSLASAITCFTFSFPNDIKLPVSTESKEDLLFFFLPVSPICSGDALAPFANLFHF